MHKFDVIFAAFALATVACVYIFWIRPILAKTPKFADFYAHEASVLSAIKLKFQGIKEKLTAAFIVVASVLVSMHDFVAPYITGDTVEKFTSQIPPWTIPLIPMVISLFMAWLRHLSDKRVEATGELTATLPTER